MGKKYYTPSIEEFHVGFEYERCDDGYSWFKDTFPRTWENGQGVGWPKLLSNAIKGRYIRVKHLDREDIESLGWDAALDDIGYGLVTQKGLYLCRPFLNSDFTIALIELRHDGRCIFFGKIRNKSELETIMRMIGIKN